jgi:hypothetical protein
MRLSKFLVIGAAVASLALVMAAPSDAQQWSPSGSKPPPVAKPRPVAPTVRDHRTTSTPTVRDHRKTEATVRDHRRGETTVTVRDHRDGANTSRRRGDDRGKSKSTLSKAADVAGAPARAAVNAGSRVVGGAKKGLKTVGDVLNPFD